MRWALCACIAVTGIVAIAAAQSPKPKPDVVDNSFCPVYVFYEDPNTTDLLYYAEEINPNTCEPLSPAFMWGDASTPCPENCPDCDQKVKFLTRDKPLPTLFPADPVDTYFHAPTTFFWKNPKVDDTTIEGYPQKGIQLKAGANGKKFKEVQIKIDDTTIHAFLIDVIVDGEAAHHPRSNALWRMSVGFEAKGIGGPVLPGTKVTNYQCSVLTPRPQGKERTYTVMTKTPLP